ncbi:hypothetical protein V8C34DRAFT_20340 [Trichoderma compactum]
MQELVANWQSFVIPKGIEGQLCRKGYIMLKPKRSRLTRRSSTQTCSYKAQNDSTLLCPQVSIRFRLRNPPTNRKALSQENPGQDPEKPMIPSYWRETGH